MLESKVYDSLQSRLCNQNKSESILQSDLPRNSKNGVISAECRFWVEGGLALGLSLFQDLKKECGNVTVTGERGKTDK